MMKGRKPKNFKSPLLPVTGIVFLLTLLLSIFTTVNTPVYALAASSADSAEPQQKVYDLYGLFTEEEIAGLEDICAEYGEDGKIDIVIITADLAGESRKKYLEDFYDEHGFGYDQEFGDTAMLLLNMQSDDRGVEIQGYGNAEYYLNNDRIEHMLDDIVRLLQTGNYYGAMEEFAKQAAYYMNEEEGVNTAPATGDIDSGNYYGESGYDGPSDYYGESADDDYVNNYDDSYYDDSGNGYNDSAYNNSVNNNGEKDSIFYNTTFQIVLALIIGAIAVGTMAANSGGRVTVHNRTYLDERHSGIVAKRDDFIRTTTTRVKRPTDNDNNGRSGGGGIRSFGGGGRSSGGGGVSSGGHSHSGGGRSF